MQLTKPEKLRNHVKEIILNFPTAVIDKIFKSLGKKIFMTIKMKGERFRY